MIRPRSTAVTALIFAASAAWVVSASLYAGAVLTDDVQSKRYQVAAALTLSIVVPGVALVAARREHRAVTSGVLLVALAIALVPAGATAVDHLRSSSINGPIRDDEPNGCAELSGGTSDCPGG